MNWRRVRRLVIKEFLQIRRDRRMIGMIVITPLLQLFLFGYALTTDVRHIHTAVLDEDRTAQSRGLVEAFVRSGYFQYDYSLSRPQEIDRLLQGGSAQVALRIPRGFAADLARGRTAQVQVALDASDSVTAGIIAGYAGEVVQQVSAQVAVERLDRVRSLVPRVPGLEARVRVWYNPELESVNFMVPGVLSMLLLMITMSMTAIAIVKERELGTLEQIIVTPIRPSELIVGKTMPFAVIGLLEMVLVLAVSTFWFRVPVKGSVPLLFALTAVFLLTSLGTGLFISTVSRTQQEAMMTGVFVQLPSMLLSGFMFPIENMPQWVQWLTYAIPLRYFLVIIRGIFLKGNGLAILWPQVLALAVFGVAVMGLSVSRFRKRLE